MLNVFNGIEKYDINKGDLAGWIYCIIRNASITLLRTKKTTKLIIFFNYYFV